MSRNRSLRRWWRDSVLTPLDAVFSRIDDDVDALTDVQYEEEPTASSAAGHPSFRSPQTTKTDAPRFDRSA